VTGPLVYAGTMPTPGLGTALSGTAPDTKGAPEIRAWADALPGGLLGKPPPLVVADDPGGSPHRDDDRPQGGHPDDGRPGTERRRQEALSGLREEILPRMSDCA